MVRGLLDFSLTALILLVMVNAGFDREWWLVVLSLIAWKLQEIEENLRFKDIIRETFRDMVKASAARAAEKKESS